MYQLRPKHGLIFTFRHGVIFQMPLILYRCIRDCMGERLFYDGAPVHNVTLHRWGEINKPE
jgi:hypothetical protein